MIPIERFEFLKVADPELKIDRLGNNTVDGEEHLEDITFPYVFDKDGSRLFHTNLLKILGAKNIPEEKDYMYTASNTLFTELDRYIKYNFDNNIVVDYGEILLSLIHSSFLTWLHDALRYHAIEFDNINIEEVVEIIKKTSHLEKIGIDIINRYHTFTYGAQADPSFYDEMNHYQQRYEDMFSILQSSLIQSLKVVFHTLYNTLDDIEDKIMDGLVTTYRQLILVSLALYYLQQLER